MKVNAALLASGRNSHTPRWTQCISCNLFASGTNLGTSPPDLRPCSPRRRVVSLHIMVILFLRLNTNLNGTRIATGNPTSVTTKCRHGDIGPCGSAHQYTGRNAELRRKLRPEGTVKLRSWMRTVNSVGANYCAFHGSLISRAQARHPGRTSQRLQLDCSANFGTLPRRLLHRV